MIIAVFLRLIKKNHYFSLDSLDSFIKESSLKGTIQCNYKWPSWKKMACSMHNDILLTCVWLSMTDKSPVEIRLKLYLLSTASLMEISCQCKMTVNNITLKNVNSWDERERKCQTNMYVGRPVHSVHCTRCSACEQCKGCKKISQCL